MTINGEIVYDCVVWYRGGVHDYLASGLTDHNIITMGDQRFIAGQGLRRVLEVSTICINLLLIKPLITTGAYNYIYTSTTILRELLSNII